MKRAVLIVVILLVLLLPLSLAGCGPKPGPIKIGLQAPLTGDYAYEGQGFEKAVRLLVDQANGQGGLLGRTIELVVEDDKGDPQEAAMAAQRLVDRQVIAVIGGYNSSATEPASAIYDQHGILHITPSSTATRLTEKGYQRFFRVCFLDDRQGLFAVKLLDEVLGARRMAILHDGSTYSQGLAEWTQKYAQDQGLQVVLFAAINPEEQDFGATLADIAAAAPDAVYFTGYHAQGGLLLRQSYEQGLPVQWVMGNASNNPELVDIAGLEAAAGTLVTTEPLPGDLPYAETQQFIRDFQERYGEAPTSVWWIMAADAFQVIRYAINQTKSSDPAALSSFLHQQFKDYAGVTGPISGFDAKGDRLGTIHKAYVITPDGAFRPYDRQPAP